MDTLKITALGLAILAGLGTAYAQGRTDEDHHGTMSFETLDIDGSGEITAEDLTARREARFAEIDTDGNGAVSEAEFVAWFEREAAERATARFAELDADGDGMLSRDVLEHGRRARFGERMIDRLDEDGSGGVSAEEFADARERMMERRGFGRHGEGRGRHRH